MARTRSSLIPALLVTGLIMLGGCATAPPATEDAQEAAPEVKEAEPSPGADETDDGAASEAAEPRPSQPAGAQPEVGAVAPAEDEPLPSAEGPAPEQREGLGGEALYRLLVADLASRQGNVELALEGYLETARQTSDPRVAERATRLALYAGRGDDALEAARRWAELAPDSRDAHGILARLHLRQGNAGPAREQLRRVVELTPGDTGQGLEQAASILGQARDPAGALDIAEALAADYPDVGVAHRAVAALALRAGAAEQALDAVQHALELTPDDADALILRARIRIARGRGDAAFEELEAAVGRYPNDRKLAIGQLRLLAQRGREQQAVRRMQRAFERFGDDPDTVYSLALLAMQASAWDDARIYLQRLVAMDAHASAAHYYLGRIAQQNGDCTGALRHYIKVRAGEHRFDAELRFAVCMAEAGRVGEARVHLGRLGARYQAKDPRVEIAVTRARVERIAGNPAKALKVLGDAVARYPEDVDLRYNRALTAARQDRFELARQDLRRILEQEPDNARALNALGYMLADRGMELERARRMIERALEQNPQDAATLDSMGWVLYRLGKRKEALAFLRKAWSHDRDPEIAAHLGEVLWVSGERQAAREVWDEGRQLEADHEVLRETIQRLTP